MNSTTTCLLQNNDNDHQINNLAQSIFIVLTFCSVISNVVIYSDKILENNEINKNFKKINNTYTVLKEYFFNNYKEDNSGNIIFEKNIDDTDNKVPDPPDSKKIEREIKDLINYQSPPPSVQKSKTLKKEIDDFLNSDNEEEDSSIKDKKILNDGSNLKHYHKSTKNQEDKIKEQRNDEKIKNRDEDKIKQDKKHKKKDDKNIKIKK
jgi:hypothetical protein